VKNELTLGSLLISVNQFPLIDDRMTLVGDSWGMDGLLLPRIPRMFSFLQLFLIHFARRCLFDAKICSMQKNSATMSPIAFSKEF
jgi:hypothetical protein